LPVLSADASANGEFRQFQEVGLLDQLQRRAGKAEVKSLADEKAPAPLGAATRTTVSPNALGWVGAGGQRCGSAPLPGRDQVGVVREEQRSTPLRSLLDNHFRI